MLLINRDMFVYGQLYLVTPRIVLNLFVFQNTFPWVCSIFYLGENAVL